MINLYCKKIKFGVMKRQISCYNCGKSGHFSTFCPEKSCGYNLNKKLKPSMSSSFQSFPVTNCRCGGGLCKIKITPKTQKCFYTCPNIYVSVSKFLDFLSFFLIKVLKFCCNWEILVGCRNCTVGTSNYVRI